MGLIRWATTKHGKNGRITSLKVSATNVQTTRPLRLHEKGLAPPAEAGCYAAQPCVTSYDGIGKG